MFERIKEDMRTILERDPAARSPWQVLFSYPGLHALAIHRAAHWCWIQGWGGFARWISHVGRFLTGIEHDREEKLAFRRSGANRG